MIDLGIAIVTLVAIVLAAVAFAARFRRRRWFAAAIVVVALCSIVDISLSLWRRGGIDGALAGGSILPFWLKPAYLMVEGVLPLAFVAAFVLGVVALAKRRRRAALGYAAVAAFALLAVQFGAYRAGTLGLPTILAFEHPVRQLPCSGADQSAPDMSGLASFGGGLLGGGSSDATPAPQPCTAAALRPPPDLSTAIAATRAQIPRERFDLDAAAAKLPADPPSVFAFVRDRIRTEVYPGAMRGAAGTLMAAAGNPSDKALLLAALLQRKGATVRFARATLGAADVASLMQAALVAPAAAATPDFSDAAADRIVKQSPGDRGALRAQLLAAVRDARAELAGAQSDANGLASSLAAQGVALGGGPSPQTSWPSLLRDHTWVQVQQGSTWIDLDPSLPTLSPNQRLAGAQTVTTSDALPDDEFATLTVAVTAGRLRSGTVATADLVNERRRVADVVNLPVEVVIASDDASSPAVIGKANAFKVHVRIAGDDLPDAPLAIQGDDGSQLLTLGMTLTVQAPGAGARVYRRTIVDRRPPGGGAAIDPSNNARATACALSTRYAGLVVAGALPPAYIDSVELDGLDGLNAIATTQPTNLPAADVLSETYPLAALRYFRRDALFAPSAARFVFDRPNIVFERTSYACPGQALALIRAFDIVENGQLALAADPQTAARANLLRGATDERIEAGLFQTPVTGVNTPSVIAAATKAKVPLVLLQPASPQALAGLHLPADSTAALQATLDAGSVALAIQQPVTVNSTPHEVWWAVDLGSGNTIGRMENGAGQDMIETLAEQMNSIDDVGTGLHFYGQMEGCVVDYFDANLSGGSEGIREVNACFEEAYCEIALDNMRDMAFGIFSPSLVLIGNDFLDQSVVCQ